MASLTDKQKAHIENALYDNATDIPIGELWEYVKDDWHTDNYEVDDKKKMEDAYVKIILSDLIGQNISTLREEGWLPETEEEDEEYGLWDNIKYGIK